MIEYDWISKWAIYSPDKIAVSEYETGRTFTYKQLNNLSNYFAFYIKNKYNLRKGDRIGVIAENTIDYFVLFFTAQKTGVIIVPLNYRLTSREINYQINDSSPTLILIETKYEQLLKDIKDLSFPTSAISLDQISNEFEQKKDLEFQFTSLHDIQEDDPLFILYTSGTTGSPKGAVYSHKMLFWNAINTILRLDITTNDRAVVCTPMFHTGGWNVIPTPFFLHGAYIKVMKKFDPDIVVKLLEEEKSTMFMAVPTMILMMSQSEYFKDADLSSMKYFIIGGEPMPIPLIDIWHKKGVPIRQGYGLTEAGPSITSLHQDDAVRKMGSIGVPNFYLNIKIVDDTGKDVNEGESGELLLKGPSVTPGYWNNKEATLSNLIDGWFHTGDIVRKDDEGYLYVVDRKKNMYISGGENVYPAEIEKFIYTHPDIKEVAIIGVPDEKWGESGMAFVVLIDNSTLQEDEIIKYCKDKIAKYKIPKYVKIVTSIPKTETGKINKKELVTIHSQTIKK